MKNFLIVARSFSDLHEEYIGIITDYIKSKGGMCILDLATCPDSSEAEVTVDDNIECIITVGGDGTVVRVAQNVTNRKIPIVGLNCGHLGYLCDMTVDNVIHCLDQLLSDNYKIDERMMLEGECSSDNNNKFRALNDIVVASEAAGLYVLNLTVKVNGIQLYCHNCDGLIVSTPTGSTAYALSNGGPVADPNLDFVSMAPICAHSLASRTYLFSKNAELVVKIGHRNKTHIVVDGVELDLLDNGSEVKIRKSDKKLRLVYLEDIPFFVLVRKKFLPN